ncbi:MAG: hypothetical protein M3Y71_11935 [Actinomycetota bacterium]|nr:hypothetical protein [Actinomycetota bacterium]
MSMTPTCARAVRRPPPVRWWGAALALSVLGLGIGGCGAGGAAYGVPIVGTCRGFASQGLELHDQTLLVRALGTWRHQGGAMAQPVPIAPPVGPVCVVDAHRSFDRVLVTLADGAHLATYQESDAGVVTLTTDAMPSSAPHVLPLVSIGDGEWALARGVTSAQVLVGAAGLPAEVEAVPVGRRVIDVDAAVNRFAAAHPGVLPHLLVLAHADGRLYAATGGAPYATDRAAVLVTSLGPDQAQRVAGWQEVLDLPSGVALLAQSVGFTTTGGLQSPQRVDRQLTLVGVTTARTGTVLVVRQEPDDGSHLAPEVVTVAQRSRGGADVQPVGTVTSPTGSWVGSMWLSPVVEGLADPRELLVMGEPGSLGSVIDLEASTRSAGLITSGPLQVVSGAELPGIDTAPTRPEVTVRGRVGNADVLPLTPLTQS